MMSMADLVINHAIAHFDGQPVTQPGHVEEPGALVVAEAALFPAKFKLINC